MPLDILNLCINVLLAFCKSVDFIFHAELSFSFSPCQCRQHDLEWCEEMRASPKGLIYFYTALLLSNVAHIFEIINVNGISLRSISVISTNHYWHFFYLAANLIKIQTDWLTFVNGYILMGVVIDTKSFQKSVSPFYASRSCLTCIEKSFKMCFYMLVILKYWPWLKVRSELQIVQLTKSHILMVVYDLRAELNVQKWFLIKLRT